MELKKIIADSGKSAKVIAKVEKPEAIDNIDEIIAATDGVMVARGDLGVEMPLEEVPLLQKMIARKCREASKPVIVATQMLESMITTPLIYLDATKEMLVTFIPMELGLSQADQQKAIGSLTNAVINSLPQEQRKGYLFTPKMALTYQGSPRDSSGRPAGGAFRKTVTSAGSGVSRPGTQGTSWSNPSRRP